MASESVARYTREVVQVTARWMNTRFSTHKGFLIQWSYLQKASGQGVRTHPPMVLLAMVRKRNINQLAFTRYQEVTRRSPLLRAKAYIYSSGTIYIRMAHADYPDVLWRLSGCLRSASVVCSSWIGEAETSFAFPRGGCGLALWYEMAPKKTVSSARVSEAGEKAIDKLDVNEFGSGSSSQMAYL
ncbi:hypothetical protein CK203_032944 [Vitis vinifera]|uniref:Uncharacterized protein n=1 Tax=Vitis vinifera TaxID=29760 RepID=A0A438HKZ7_VITVI|nr:hypothetical protein CK203_032944 [Vitis vinifera]